MWLKVFKTFKGGRSQDDYIELPDGEKEEYHQDYAISWAEDSPGGENYGWVVHWKAVEHPPLEWLRKELRYTISSLQRYAVRQNKKIMRLLEEIRCLKDQQK